MQECNENGSELAEQIAIMRRGIERETEAYRKEFFPLIMARIQTPDRFSAMFALMQIAADWCIDTIGTEQGLRSFERALATARDRPRASCPESPQPTDAMSCQGANADGDRPDAPPSEATLARYAELAKSRGKELRVQLERWVARYPESYDAFITVALMETLFDRLINRHGEGKARTAVDAGFDFAAARHRPQL